MNTQTKYMYVMHAAGAAGAPILAAYPIEKVGDGCSELEVARARQAAEPSQDINTNETVNSVYSLSRAVWRFAARNLRRKPAPVRVAA